MVTTPSRNKFGMSKMFRTLAALMGLLCLSYQPLALTYTPSPRSNSAYDTVHHAVPLRRVSEHQQPSSRLLHSESRQSQQRRQLATNLLDIGSSFVADLTVGSQTFPMIVDTGSADTWLPSHNFTCIDLFSGYTVHQSVCNLTSTYTPAASFQQIADQNFNLSYGSTEYLLGVLGYEAVNFAGLAVKKQEIALVTLAAVVGDGMWSGIVGLGYPWLTSAFPGPDATKDDPCSPGETDCNQVPYSSIINTMFFVENVTAPVFAFAISRDESRSKYGGAMTMGGVPDNSHPTVNITHYAPRATTPIEFLAKDNHLQYYAVAVDGFDYDDPLQGAWNASGQYIIDTGTTLNYLPGRHPTAINKLFNPPAVFDPDYGLFTVSCKPTSVPRFGVRINGAVFYHNPVDMVLPGNKAGTFCISAIQSSGNRGTELSILGDAFLKNVMAVFDVGQGQMEFTGRMYYQS